MAKKKIPTETPATTDAVLTAILAAVVWPDDFRSGRTAEAIRRAHRLIKSVPDYLSGKNSSLKESFQDFWLESEQRIEEAREWGFADPWSRKLYEKTKSLPEGVLSFEQAITEGICPHHKTLKGLEELLRSVGYPEYLFRSRVITKLGYERALEKQKAKQREADRNRKRKTRSEPNRSKKNRQSA
jgi:hypothetical protein